jgi:hypothetical protein
MVFHSLREWLQRQAVNGCQKNRPAYVLEPENACPCIGMPAGRLFPGKRTRFFSHVASGTFTNRITKIYFIAVALPTPA